MRESAQAESPPSAGGQIVSARIGPAKPRLFGQSERRALTTKLTCESRCKSVVSRETRIVAPVRCALYSRRSRVGMCARVRQAKLARRDTPRSMQPSTVHQSRSCTAFSGSHRFGKAWLLMIPSSSGSTNR